MTEERYEYHWEWISKRYFAFFLLFVLFLISPLIYGHPFNIWSIEVMNFLTIICSQWWFIIGLVWIFMSALKEDILFYRRKRRGQVILSAPFIGTYLTSKQVDEVFERHLSTLRTSIQKKVIKNE